MDARNLHELSGEAVERVVKSAMNKRSVDNVTGVLIIFGNFAGKAEVDLAIDCRSTITFPKCINTAKKDTVFRKRIISKHKWTISPKNATNLDPSKKEHIEDGPQIAGKKMEMKIAYPAFRPKSEAIGKYGMAECATPTSEKYAERNNKFEKYFRMLDIA